jgi:tRNA-specific adenosine deaminase 3
MALALGLGSLFNHSENPNVSYTLDASTDSIRFKATKMIQTGDEMCIFYGHNLWFEPVGPYQRSQLLQQEPDDEWGGLAVVFNYMEAGHSKYPAFLDGDPDEIIAVADLPFTRYKIAQDEDEEEELSAIRTSKLSYTFYLSEYNHWFYQ